MKVEIRPIEKTKWHGKTGQESFTRPHSIGALVDQNTMKYKHGLSEKDLALLKERGCEYDLSDHYIAGQAHPFWEAKMSQIKLENKTMFLQPEKNMLDFIKTRICKASKYVANSLEEWEAGLWPHATHIIYDEAVEVQAKASKVEMRKKAILESVKLPTEKKIQLIMIVGGIDVKGKSDSHIEVKLDELINDDSKVEEVLNFINLGSENLEVHSLVLECMMKNILRKNGHKIEYNGSVLGNDVYEVIEYLALDENQALKLRLAQAVND